MGFFNKSTKPDRRLLRLDDDFTGGRKPPSQILSDLQSISAASLSGKDEEYRQRLIDIMKRRINGAE